jgi:hypothetical protein
MSRLSGSRAKAREPGSHNDKTLKLKRSAALATRLWIPASRYARSGMTLGRVLINASGLDVGDRTITRHRKATFNRSKMTQLGRWECIATAAGTCQVFAEYRGNTLVANLQCKATYRLGCSLSVDARQETDMPLVAFPA